MFGYKINVSLGGRAGGGGGLEMYDITLPNLDKWQPISTKLDIETEIRFSTKSKLEQPRDFEASIPISKNRNSNKLD